MPSFKTSLLPLFFSFLATVSAAAVALVPRSQKGFDLCSYHVVVNYPSYNLNNYKSHPDIRPFYHAAGDDDTNLEIWDIQSLNEPKEGAGYHTEHIFEAQILNGFFASRNDYCTKYDHNAYSSLLDDLSYDMCTEIGGSLRETRLVYLQDSLNTVKGRLFSGIQPISDNDFQNLGPQDQLINMRNLAATLDYMNEPTVWGKFCDTYNAMRFAIRRTWGNHHEVANWGTEQDDLMNSFRSYVEGRLDQFDGKARTYKYMMMNEHQRGSEYDRIWEDHDTEIGALDNIGCMEADGSQTLKRFP